MSEETIVFRGSPSALVRLGPLLLGGLVLAGSLIALAYYRESEPAVLWVLGALAAAAAIYLIMEIVVLKATEYEVTSERVRIRRGVLSKRTDELELYRANDTTLIEPLSMRMVGLGTIVIRTMEENNSVVQLEAVRGARELRESLRNCIETCRDRKRVRMMEMDEHLETGH